MSRFLETLQIQRHDDHRYYHHSRINQSLHLLSALSFLCAYGLLFVDPALAGLMGWLVSMTTRQAGHFFFEPKTYDYANQVTHEYKEQIKVGYNLNRKIVLLSIWALSPLILLVEPTLWGLTEPYHDAFSFMHSTGYVWLALGCGGLLFRTVHLCFIYNVRSALAWMAKILTDPFHDVKLYYKAPLALLRGELIDPSIGKHHDAEEEDEICAQM